MNSVRLFELSWKYSCANRVEYNKLTFYSLKFCFDNKNKYFQLRY